MSDRQSREAAEEAVRTLLYHIGEDPTREGLEDTPRRVVDALEEMTEAPEYDLTTFEPGEYDQLIVETGIPVYSLCEHHMLPVVGTASVGYIPDGKIVGLSKLARCVEKHARRLQNQERLTQDVCSELHEELEAVGTGVVVRARHFCMEMRGVRKRGTETQTSALLGALREEGPARNEFVELTVA